MGAERNIKLLIATGLYPPDIGGPATYARMLEEKLPAHNVTVDILAFGTVRHLPKMVRHIAFAFALYKKAKNADIVYALDPISVGLPAWFVSMCRRKPFIIRLGGDYAWEQGQQRFGLQEYLDEYTANRKKSPLPVKILAFLQGFVVRRALKVVAPSEYLKSIIATWGVEDAKLVVIYSALFPLEVSSSKETLREQLSYAGTTIVSSGRLVPWKGFVALIEVMQELPDATLVLIGDGPEHDILQAKVEALGLAERVRLVGRLSKEALGASIKAADVFVLNTAYEGLSHQLLEVMDLGVPIVTTHVGGNPELIKDGFSGLLVPFDDKEGMKKAIERIVHNEDFRIRLVQNARIRTKDFSQDRVVEQFVERIIMQVCKN